MSFLDTSVSGKTRFKINLKHRVNYKYAFPNTILTFV